MELLFFDLEFATCKNGKKICEFGYVVTNENFNIIKSENILINPNIKFDEWDWYAVKNVLTYKIEEYEVQPDFSYYYAFINELFESVDYIFGYSVKDDKKGLNDDCIRYGLESFVHGFYDVKKIYKKNLNKKDCSLSKAIKELEIKSNSIIHNALGDSLNTMLVLKEICVKTAKDIDKIIKEYNLNI